MSDEITWSAPFTHRPCSHCHCDALNITDPVEHEPYCAYRKLAEADVRFHSVTAELAEVRAVLDDMLHERGESWLAQLVGRRGLLMRTLGHLGGDDNANCRYCLVYGGHHNRDCAIAKLLRAAGGERQTQRQVDAAHEAALRSQQIDDFVTLMTPPTGDDE